MVPDSLASYRYEDPGRRTDGFHPVSEDLFPWHDISPYLQHGIWSHARHRGLQTSPILSDRLLPSEYRAGYHNGTGLPSGHCRRCGRNRHLTVRQRDSGHTGADAKL